MKKVLSLILCAILLALTLTGCGKTDADKYTDAKKQLASGNYTEALAGFEEINGYEDSSRFINYVKAIMLAEEGNYEQAQSAFDGIPEDFEETKTLKVYYTARQYEDEGKWSEAQELYLSIPTTRDSTQRVEDKYTAAKNLLDAGKYDEAAAAYDLLGSYKDASDMVCECQYLKAVTLQDAGQYENAAEAFAAIFWYKDATDKENECWYQRATELNASGQYNEAYVVYATLTGYADVDSIIETDANISTARADYIAQFSVGKTVTFGSYAGEAIEWIVLEASGDDRVLLAKYGIESMPYNYHKYGDYESHACTWETCTLRTWLNGEFYKSAFTDLEKKQIITSYVKNDDNQLFKTEGGANTFDHVYLLSFEEVKTYFSSDREQVCIPTAHAVENGVLTLTQEEVTEEQSEYNYPLTVGAAHWWLRSPGGNDKCAGMVAEEGYILKAGFPVFNDVCVRPVITVRLSNN